MFNKIYLINQFDITWPLLQNLAKKVGYFDQIGYFHQVGQFDQVGQLELIGHFDQLKMRFD